jgi:hypothetical protein
MNFIYNFFKKLTKIIYRISFDKPKSVCVMLGKYKHDQPKQCMQM